MELGSASELKENIDLLFSIQVSVHNVTAYAEGL